jgi:hypothetical protein
MFLNIIILHVCDTIVINQYFIDIIEAGQWFVENV